MGMLGLRTHVRRSNIIVDRSLCLETCSLLLRGVHHFFRAGLVRVVQGLLLNQARYIPTLCTPLFRGCLPVEHTYYLLGEDTCDVAEDAQVCTSLTTHILRDNQAGLLVHLTSSRSGPYASTLAPKHRGGGATASKNIALSPLGS